jgi:hypothetical protein
VIVPLVAAELVTVPVPKTEADPFEPTEPFVAGEAAPKEPTVTVYEVPAAVT